MKISSNKQYLTKVKTDMLAEIDEELRTLYKYETTRMGIGFRTILETRIKCLEKQFTSISF